MTRAFVTWRGADDGIEQKPLLTLRIFERGNTRRHYIEVYIWRHLWQVRALRSAQKKRTIAFFHGYRSVRTEPAKNGSIVGCRKLGNMHLPMKRLTYNTIVHESYHAVREFSVRAKLNEPSTEKQRKADYENNQHWNEERAAEYIGYIADTIIVEALKIIPVKQGKKHLPKKSTRVP